MSHNSLPQGTCMAHNSLPRAIAEVEGFTTSTAMHAYCCYSTVVRDLWQRKQTSPWAFTLKLGWYCNDSHGQLFLYDDNVPFADTDMPHSTAVSANPRFWSRCSSVLIACTFFSSLSVYIYIWPNPCNREAVVIVL